MTRARHLSRILCSVLLVGLLTITTGCVEQLVAAGLGVFGTGFVLGRITTPTTTTTQCFQNGEPIDCSEVQQ
jgi:hypothetical protein